MIKVIFYGKSLMPILRRDRQHATWGQLLRDAVEKPGRMLAAYTAFHNYSFGNALLALANSAFDASSPCGNAGYAHSAKDAWRRQSWTNCLNE